MQTTRDTMPDSKIRIAYIVLCHDEPRLLRRIAQVLQYGDDKIFVHVDKKVDASEFVAQVCDLDHVCLIEDRVEVYWGGFNSIIATMNLIRAVLHDAVHYDRIVLLQGKDYPLHSPAYIHRFFEENEADEFCRSRNITRSNDPGDYMKCCGYWNPDGRKTFLKRYSGKALWILNSVIKKKYRRGYFVYKGQRWDVYKGWAQIALTREAAEYVVHIYDTVPGFNRFMRHRFPPDEIYIHTILENSPFKKRISDYLLSPRIGAEWFDECMNLTYFEYPVTVTVFQNEDDYKKLVETGALFVRKVTYRDSGKLLEEIDKQMILER